MAAGLDAVRGATNGVVGRILMLATAACFFTHGIASHAAETVDQSSSIAAPSLQAMPISVVGRPHDQLWLVSCRQLAYRGQEDELNQLRYTVHHAATGWTASDQAAFQQASDASLTTCVLALGNGYTASQTRSLGQTAYHRLVIGLPPERAVRFVIWSWPSDHTDAGAVKDLRIKAGRTPQVAHCLARWLDEVPPSARVSLLGTSFGARIVMEALDLRGGGRIGDRQLAAPASLVRPKVNVVLISAAIDNDWLLPGRRLDLALSQTDRILLINNTSDAVLKRYHWLYGRRSKTAALGSTGLRFGGRLGPSAEKVAQIDAAPMIGRHHGCAPYFDSPRLVTAMRDYLFDDQSKGPPIPAPQILPKEGATIPVASSGPSGADGRR